MGTPVAAFLSIVVAAATLAMPCLAAHFTVGDANGWDLTTNFGDWLDGKKFHVGDTLGFKYTSTHNVVEVSKADYAACQAGNALKTYTDGQTTVPLKTAGKMYFICGVPGHCAGGMKVGITVKAAASGAAAPSPTPLAKAPAATAKSPAATDTSSEPAHSSDTTSAAAAFSAAHIGLAFAAAVAAAGFVLL
ncbi:hypothetical protein SUGI_0988270 [Cryptomeria japonica]|uniref:mavicyanin-like n=1 Tax=Cryptomeria japonica TaxID=3369 RepID=UPI0024146ABD|nr:mavicyanin-like [Cryptomeria japonica]GLJ46850.1 hypothetical protein SUGI_0988270 [Cryptomeria japonica]